MYHSCRVMPQWLFCWLDIAIVCAEIVKRSPCGRWSVRCDAADKRPFTRGNAAYRQLSADYISLRGPLESASTWNLINLQLRRQCGNHWGLCRLVKGTVDAQPSRHHQRVQNSLKSLTRWSGVFRDGFCRPSLFVVLQYHATSSQRHGSKWSIDEIFSNSPVFICIKYCAYLWVFQSELPTSFFFRYQIIVWIYCCSFGLAYATRCRFHCW